NRGWRRDGDNSRGRGRIAVGVISLDLVGVTDRTGNGLVDVGGRAHSGELGESASGRLSLDLEPGLIIACASPTQLNLGTARIVVGDQVAWRGRRTGWDGNRNGG